MATKIRVMLNAREVVHYKQVVEMTEAQYREMAATNGEGLAELVDMWLNRHDIYDGEDLQDDDVSIFKCDKDGKKLKGTKFIGGY